jgi:hypothetical protein
MTTLHETAYPSLKPDPTPRELAELYTPTEDEKLLAAGVGKRALPCMAALIHLKPRRPRLSESTLRCSPRANHCCR